LAVSPRGQVNWNVGDSAFGRKAYRLRSGPWIVLESTNVSEFSILRSAVL